MNGDARLIRQLLALPLWCGPANGLASRREDDRPRIAISTPSSPCESSAWKTWFVSVRHFTNYDHWAIPNCEITDCSPKGDDFRLSD